MNASFQEELSAALLDSRAEWEKRLEAIRSDRRRKPEADLDDQAIELENDEALDALDARARRQLDAIAAALDRLHSGTFGRCAHCGEPIPAERLRARPTADSCLRCARGDAG